VQLLRVVKCVDEKKKSWVQSVTIWVRSDRSKGREARGMAVASQEAKLKRGENVRECLPTTDIQTDRQTDSVDEKPRDQRAGRGGSVWLRDARGKHERQREAREARRQRAKAQGRLQAARLIAQHGLAELAECSPRAERPRVQRPKGRGTGGMVICETCDL